VSRDHIEILHAYEVATGRSCAGLSWDMDLVAAFGLTARDITRIGELVEESCSVKLLPVDLIDWAIGNRTVEALERLVVQRRGHAIGPADMAGAGPIVPPAGGFQGHPGSMGRVR